MILAIDIGTTFLKVALVDLKGKILFSQKRVIDFNNDDNSRIDPNKWEKGLAYLCSSIPVNLLSSISSVVVSGNGPTLVPVDSRGESIGLALLWNDDSALDVLDEMNEKLGFYLPANFFLSKAYWFKKNNPDLYDITDSFLSCPEYISFLLTGNKFTLLPEKGFIDYYWSKNSLEKLDLNIDKFPPYITPFEPYGHLISNGILPNNLGGVPVICSGPDFLMSVLGTGTISPGIVCDRTGTSEGLNFCSGTYQKVDGLRTLPHMIPGLYTIAGLIPNSGEYVLSDRLDLLITEYKYIINKMIMAGLDVKEIRVIGGHSSIEKLNKLKAECFNITLKIYPDGSDLIGNAILGSVVTGVYSTIKEACKNMIREKHCYNI